MRAVLGVNTSGAQGTPGVRHGQGQEGPAKIITGCCLCSRNAGDTATRGQSQGCSSGPIPRSQLLRLPDLMLNQQLFCRCSCSMLGPEDHSRRAVLKPSTCARRQARTATLRRPGWSCHSDPVWMKRLRPEEAKAAQGRGPLASPLWLCCIGARPAGLEATFWKST